MDVEELARMKEVRWKKTERRGAEEVFKGSASGTCDRGVTSVHGKVSLACPNAVAALCNRSTELKKS